MFTSFGFGGLLVETAFLDLLEQTFFGDSALEALQEFLGVFAASECDANQVVSLSLSSSGWIAKPLASTNYRNRANLLSAARPPGNPQVDRQEPGIVEDAPGSGK